MCKRISLVNYITSVLLQFSESLKTNPAFNKKCIAMDGKLQGGGEGQKKTLLNMLFAPPHMLMSTDL